MKDIKSNDEIINYSSDKYTYTSDNKVEDSSNLVSNSTKNENDLSDKINETTFDSSYGSAINSDLKVPTVILTQIQMRKKIRLKQNQIQFQMKVKYLHIQQKLKVNILLILYLILNSKLMKIQKNIIPLFLIQIHIK